MNWKPGTPLTADQTRHAVLWHAPLSDFGYTPAIPAPDVEWFLRFWGDGKDTRRLKTFGHVRARDSTSAHFVCTRGGLPWHTDPGYTRYALQIQLANPGGYVVHGLDDKLEDLPLYVPGLVILLDTWSPHRISLDPRLPRTTNNKLLCGADYAERPGDIAQELPRLVDHIARFPL